jgi:hypothetical protein
MKKHVISVLGVAVSAGVLLVLAGCLNPVGFNPELKLELNANVSGELDTTDVTSAVLQIVNHTLTVDVERIEITQPEWTASEDNPTAQAPSVTFSQKPMRGTKKAQYLRPSDKNYHVIVAWRDYLADPTKNIISNPNDGVAGSKVFSIPLPLPKQVVDLHIYRDKEGVIIIDKEVGERGDDYVDPDPPTESPADGEGSSPAIIPSYNRDKMGAFIVMNMTKTQPIDSVRFAMLDKVYSIMTVTSGGNSVPAVRAKDQQSIALGQGSWVTQITYTSGGASRAVGPKNSIVIPINDPQALRTNYLYFYRTKTGTYDVSHVWPPIPNDASNEDNTAIEDLLDDTHGILEVINKSDAHTVVQGIDINNVIRMQHPDYLYADQSVKFIVEAGIVNVRFLSDKSGGDYGQVNPVRVNPRETKTLVYYDNLGQPDAYPPGTGKIKIINNSTLAYVTHVNVIDPDTGKIISLPNAEFIPSGSIGPGGSIGRVLVEGTNDVPLITGKQYLIQVLVRNSQGSGAGVEYFAVERQAVIKDNLVVITLSQQDIKVGSTIKTTINVENQTTSAGITGIQVTGPAGTASFAPSSPVVKPDTYSVAFKSSSIFPIVQGTNYNVRISLSDGAQTYVVDKSNLELYNRIIYITVTDSDITGVPPPDITYSVTANGDVNNTTTALTFTFSSAPALAIGDIVFTDSTYATKGSPLTQITATEYTLLVTATGTGPVMLKINKTGIEAQEKAVNVFKYQTPPPPPTTFKPVTDVTTSSISLTGNTTTGYTNTIQWTVVPPDSTHGHQKESSASNPVKWTGGMPSGDWSVTYDNATERLTVYLGPSWKSQAQNPDIFRVVAYIDKGVSESGSTILPIDLWPIAGAMVSGKPYYEVITFNVNWQ